MRLTTPHAVAVGTSISGRLTYGDDAVRIRGVVRWRNESDPDPGDDAALAFWEVGLAFTSIGEVDPEGIWRRLEVHRGADPPGSEPRNP